MIPRFFNQCNYFKMHSNSCMHEQHVATQPYNYMWQRSLMIWDTLRGTIQLIRVALYGSIHLWLLDRSKRKRDKESNFFKVKNYDLLNIFLFFSIDFEENICLFTLVTKRSKGRVRLSNEYIYNIIVNFFSIIFFNFF